MGTLIAELQSTTPWPWLRLLPLLPLIGAVTNGLFGRALQERFGRRTVAGIGIGVMALAAVAAVVAVVALARLAPGDRFLVDRLWPLVHVGPVQVDLAFALDPLSAVMILVITVVGTLIHLYSAAYMAEDPGFARFFAYLNLFVFSMLLLVLGDSFLLLFFGWEGVGLCSYLLIGFWYRDRAKAAAGMKAFVTNRVGDWGFLIGLGLLFWGLAAPGAQDRTARQTVSAQVTTSEGRQVVNVPVGPTLNFRELRDQLALKTPAGAHPFASRLLDTQVWGLPVVVLAGLFFFVGIAGKSAQIPLYVWLPDAMAGPTPVSALIHAATMVTAGVYLVARLSFLFAWAAEALTVIAWAGVATAFLGALLAVFQHDLKRVLAYSTISQLGFMFVAVGVGAYGAGVFHLVTHACFKACLFLAAGSVIHAMEHALPHAAEHGHEDPRLAANPHDPQDLRNMGGLAALMPRTRLAYLLACVSIAGFPIAAGFYSKDEILLRALTQDNIYGPAWLLWGIGLLTAGMTAFYMFRSYYLAFGGRPPPPAVADKVHESPRLMTGVLIALAALSVIVGPLLGWPEAWGGHPFLEHFLAPVVADAQWLTRFVHLPRTSVLLVQLGSVLVALAGWGVARALYADLARTEGRLLAWRARWDGLHRALYHKLFVDEAYDTAVVQPALDFARGFAWIDRHLIDGVVNGCARLGRALSVIGAWIDSFLVDGIVNGVSTLALASGRRLARLQTGRINNYVLGLTLGIVLLVVVTWMAR